MPRRAFHVLGFCALLVLSACSFVVDFPEAQQEDRDPATDEMDAGERGKRDSGAGRDAKPDAKPDAKGGEASIACNPDNHNGCGKNQLCCSAGASRAPSCVDVSQGACESCNNACTDRSRPYCSERDKGCECELGTGKGCEPGTLCSKGEDGIARCVQCNVDSDCKSPTPVCLQNRCVQCDRGKSADDASDDRGCSGATPICGPRNTCESCVDAPKSNCPNGQSCTPGVGCFGCRLDDATSCPAATPICREVTVAGARQRQCTSCTANAECKLPYLYCDESTGRCNKTCDPGKGGENDACEGELSICKQQPNGEVACEACESSDCEGAKPHCATAGHQRRGQCIGCRNNGDCVSGTAPVCDSTRFECRARVAEDCRGTDKPHFVAGECVACTIDDHCEDGYCSANVCGECKTSAECRGMPSTPICNTSMSPSRCVAGCASDTQCAGQPGTPFCDSTRGVCVACKADNSCPASAPLCVDGACKPCTEAGNQADQKCAARASGGGPFCIRGGPSDRKGRCGACDPADGSGRQRGCMNEFCSPSTASCIACDVASDQGCMDDNGAKECVVRAGESTPSCNACDPAAPNSCPAGSSCRAASAGMPYTCVRSEPADAGAGDAAP